MALLGIDVHHAKGAIDWAAVKRSGRIFAITKQGQGTSFRDSRGLANLRGLKAAGMVPGGYWFLEPGDGAAQARLLHAALKEAGGPGGMLAAVDAEKATATRWPATADLDEFCAAWDRLAPGHPLIVYTAPWFVNGYWGGRVPASARGRPLWNGLCSDRQFAAYAGWTGEVIRQYSCSGRVPTVDGDCDLDRFYGDLADLKRLAGAGQQEEPDMTEAEWDKLRQIVRDEVEDGYRLLARGQTRSGEVSAAHYAHSTQRANQQIDVAVEALGVDQALAATRAEADVDTGERL
jgi:GH25 family lysozyme M1 (1,4-beta-N-acetylmuramidase)